MVLPLGPHAGPQHIIKLTKSQTDGPHITREQLIPVRFVPLLPGQAGALADGCFHSGVLTRHCPVRGTIEHLPGSL